MQISITAIESLSPLGNSPEQVWQSYLEERHFLAFAEGDWRAPLASSAREEVAELASAGSRFKNLDPTVHFALAASRRAVARAGWDSNFGINIGSSRGATTLFEKHHSEFLASGRAATLASPATTLGNISSWVAQDLQSSGPEISHSITCSTSLHALLNGVAWLKSGMADKFLVGGSEAPLTPFTIAQMKALKIYAKPGGEFPCRAMDFYKKSNGMVLGEGAAACCLVPGSDENALAVISGVGYATESTGNATAISAQATCFQKSMAMALGGRRPDVIVMHAPGTIAGDKAEMAAIKAVLGEDVPLLTTNKWKMGHTFGASGLLSVEFAVMMMQHSRFIGIPYLAVPSRPAEIKSVLVNSVGFGGNAVSVLLERP